MHLLGRQHHETPTRQQRRSRECEGEVAHRLELCAIEDGAIGLPHADRQPRRGAGDESACGDPVHRNLAALSILLDDEDLADALDDTLDHVTVGQPHHICRLCHRNRRATLNRESCHTVQGRIDGAKPEVLPYHAHATVRIRECASERSRKALAISHHHLRLARHSTEGRPALATRKESAPIRSEDRERAIHRRAPVSRHERAIGCERRIGP